MMPPFVTKMSCSFDMAYDSNYLDRMLQLHLYMEGAWKEFTAQLPAEGHVEAGKGHIIKTRYGVVAVVSIFFICLFIDLIRWWHRSY